MNVTCTDCRETFDVYDTEPKVARGELTKSQIPNGYGYSTLAYFGICDACQRLAHRRLPRKAGTVEQDAARFQKLIADQRQLHPTWKLRTCVQAASKIFHDPHNEPDPGFRAYLLDSE